MTAQQDNGGDRDEAEAGLRVRVEEKTMKREKGIEREWLKYDVFSNLRKILTLFSILTKKLILLFHGNYFSSMELLLLHHDGLVSPPPPRGPSSPPPPDLASLLHHGIWFLLPLLGTYSLSRPYMLHHCSLRERNTTVITIDFALVFIILSLFPLSISSVGIDFLSCLFESVEA
ncbi:hypothetical protein ACSQ67_001009 [Phaseolus vulgaris]